MDAIAQPRAGYPLSRPQKLFLLAASLLPFWFLVAWLAVEDHGVLFRGEGPHAAWFGMGFVVMSFASFLGMTFAPCLSSRRSWKMKIALAFVGAFAFVVNYLVTLLVAILILGFNID